MPRPALPGHTAALGTGGGGIGGSGRRITDKRRQRAVRVEALSHQTCHAWLRLTLRDLALSCALRPADTSLSFTLAINQVLVPYATEQYDPLCSHARGHEFLLDLSGNACRPCSAPEMRSCMRLPSCVPSFCFSKPLWVPRIITSSPKMSSDLPG